MAIHRSPSALSCVSDEVPQGDRWWLWSGAVVVVMGDSNTTNQDPTFYNCWGEFKNAIDLCLSARGLAPITWINQGIGGAYTDTIQQDAQVNAIIAAAPTHVICHIGANDPRSIPNATSVMHYNTWFNKLYVGLPDVRVLMTTAISDEETAEDMSALAASWRQIARERNVPCVDLYSSYVNVLTPAQRTATTIDGVHISTGTGRAWWASNVLFQTKLSEIAS